MRVRSLSVAGFRGFPRPVTLDLDADAVVIGGVNGSGKTSLFDAILWAMAGAIGRLGGDSAHVVSQYSPSGEARVELVLERPSGTTLTVVRRFDGSDHLSVADGDAEAISGAAANSVLMEALWPDAKSAPEPSEALARSLTRATYLQQDAVREFVEAEEEQERFTVVSELVGVGRVGELQRQLESSRSSWSRATNALSREMEPVRRQRAATFERLERLGAIGDSTSMSTAFREWTQTVAEFLPRQELRRPTDWSAQALDRALTTLEALQRREERRHDALHRLLGHLVAPVPAADPLDRLRSAVHAAELMVQKATQGLETAESEAAALRRRQIEDRNRADALRALAELSLDHLAERCPVCSQDYDREATRARLQKLAGAGSELRAVSGTDDGVRGAAAHLEAAEVALASARAALRDGERRESARQAWEQTLEQHARDAGVTPATLTEASVTDALRSVEGAVDLLRNLRGRGEKLALQIARAAELSQQTELQRQLASLDAKLERQERDLELREETGEVASELISALRDAGTSIVTSELTRIEPLLQRVYATVDPHPSFRAVRFLTRMSRGRGRLWTSLDDRETGVSVDEPAIVLSSSQLNVLAVSTFLSLNLAIESLPLQLVALDDPLQSLDNVNLLGLADLLRRIKAVRQVIVSTHDERLASLLARKLRPIHERQRTRLVELSAWTREGPRVEQSDVAPDRASLRLASSA